MKDHYAPVTRSRKPVQEKPYLGDIYKMELEVALS